MTDEKTQIDRCPKCGTAIEQGTYHYCEEVCTTCTEIFNNYLYF